MHRTMIKTAVLSAALALGIAGAAVADTGAFARSEGRVDFYATPSAGDALSNVWNVSTSRTSALCFDAENVGGALTFYGNVYRQVQFQTDPVVARGQANFNSSLSRVTYSAPGGTSYKAQAIWPKAPSNTETRGYSTAKNC